MDFGVLRSVDGRIGFLTLDRPDSRNALDDQLIAGLADGLNWLNRNQDVRTIVLQGTGAAFCAGMNLAYLQTTITKSVEENTEEAKSLQRLLIGIRQSRKPVIAMVDGPAMGGGCGLAASCDFVFAGEETAKFGVPEVRLGFVPAVILEFLIHRMGVGRTREFVLRGGVMDAKHALAAGLVTEVVPSSGLKARVVEFAASLADQTSPSSAGLTKELLLRYDEMSRKDAQEFAANLNALIRRTDDFKRGVEASVNKEKITW